LQKLPVIWEKGSSSHPGSPEIVYDHRIPVQVALLSRWTPRRRAGGPSQDPASECTHVQRAGRLFQLLGTALTPLHGFGAYTANWATYLSHADNGDRPVRSPLGRVKQLVTSSQAGFQGPLPPSDYARRHTRPTSSHAHHVSDQWSCSCRHFSRVCRIAQYARQRCATFKRSLPHHAGAGAYRAGRETCRGGTAGCSTRHTGIHNGGNAQWACSYCSSSCCS
jgi:hypothetical protein